MLGSTKEVSSNIKAQAVVKTVRAIEGSDGLVESNKQQEISTSGSHQRP
jgi:hypothetical protein